jgi:hypothetical protein
MWVRICSTGAASLMKARMRVSAPSPCARGWRGLRDALAHVLDAEPLRAGLAVPERMAS